MALIKCPDCGSNISDSAEQCIYCGCDLFLHKEELRMDEEIEIKVSEYEQRMKKPEQVKSLSEIHQYRNENE